MHVEPGGLISVNFIICEKITEEGGAVTAGRIVDVFVVNELDPTKVQLLPVQIAALMKFDSGFPRDHSARVQLEYPSGHVVDVIADIKMPVSAAKSAVQKSAYGNTASTHSFSVLAGVRLGVEQLGRHYLTLWIDDRLAACEPLTFALQEWMTGG